MEYGISYYFKSFPTPKLVSNSRSFWKNNNNNLVSFNVNVRTAAIVVSVKAKKKGREEKLSFCSVNTPLEARSGAGEYLRGVLQNQRELFDCAVEDELKRLVCDRQDAVLRSSLCLDNDQATLHRRIARMKELECQISIEDVMYVMIISRFSDIGVHLVPRLSRCICNNRLEILPSKDWELESIHGFEFLELIKEHISAMIGLRANSSVTEHWAITKIQRSQLGQVYAASILFGYFLKSVSLRLRLEQCLGSAHLDQHLSQTTSLHFPEPLPHGLGNILWSRVSNIRSSSWGQSPVAEETRRDRLRGYVMGFDAETMQICAKVKSKESINLMENHTSALVGGGKTNVLEDNQEILTSFSSLKRLVLEAIAFGIFLWDAEDYIGTVYKLAENK